MSENEKNKSTPPFVPRSTEEVAFLRMFASEPSEADRLRALDLTLRQMSQERGYNPQSLNSAAQMQRENVKPSGAAEVVTAGEEKRERGWADAKPLSVHCEKGSHEERLLDGIVEKFTGGPNGPVKKE